MSHSHKPYAIDVHAHYFPQSFLDLIAKHGPAYGFEYKMVEGKGPQFKHGHLMTGLWGRSSWTWTRGLQRWTNREWKFTRCRCRSPWVLG